MKQRSPTVVLPALRSPLPEQVRCIVDWEILVKAVIAVEAVSDPIF